VLTLAQLITFNVSSKQLGSANCVTSVQKEWVTAGLLKHLEAARRVLRTLEQRVLRLNYN